MLAYWKREIVAEWILISDIQSTYIQIIKKTILVANLAAHDMNKPTTSKSSRLVHTVVTSVIIGLDSSMNECNIATAVELVKRQVGFYVVLLDCKLFPLIESESTSFPDFWKSTCKIIAASRSTYEKLVGVSAGEELSQMDITKLPYLSNHKKGGREPVKVTPL